MIDDELLQELLGKASGLYNNGEYRSAIEAWKEALKVDPGSQKAREGIQMATLLAGCEAGDEAEPQPEPAAAADGAPPEGEEGVDLEARLDRGIQRVRGLLDERRYSEAVEGARSLVPMDPDSEEVQRLVEDAQQAFESAPFIEEHLTLARELASQDRLDEAETECRKVFVLDRANPEAHSLIADLRRRARTKPLAEAPAAAQPDMGGMTLKMDLSEVLDEIQVPESQEPEPEPQSEAAPAGARAVPAAEETLAEPLSSEMIDFDLDLGGSETTRADPPAAEQPAPELDLSEGPELEGNETAAPKEADAGAEDVEIIDADTVVPPSVRLVPRTGEEQPDAESWLTRLDTPEPAPRAPSEAENQPSIPLARPSAPVAQAGGWEQELESLNLQSGQHDILGRSAARAPAAPTTDVDSDLSCLLEGDLGSPSAETAAPEEKPEPSPAVRARGEEGRRATSRGRMARREQEEAPPPETGSRRAIPVYFGLLGVLLLAGGATAWWFFFQPGTAAGQVPSAVTPPSASSGEKAGPEHGPLPTPIGSTSREPVRVRAINNDASLRGEVAQAAPKEVAPAPREVAPPAPPAEPPPRPKSPEEVRAEVAQHMSEGRRFVAAQKWREARDEFAAVIALDPVNFQAKELLDQSQVHVNEETKVRQDVEQARGAFEGKDYQGALWKLYRLPRDPRLGDVDRAIRNAWFNWAVMGLKNGDATNALQKLSEALSVDPDDADAAKLQEVAERYASKPKDKIFYSFVDSLKYRAFDQR
ncbi:MAG TPA: hypothetical protein VFB95_15130 [Candidatus Cryosericum sp.]|nr:hypothetical protein [Candidatus Cryosericum sp.]